MIQPGQVTVAANGSLNKIILPGNYDDMFQLTCWEQGRLTGTDPLFCGERQEPAGTRQF